MIFNIQSINTSYLNKAYPANKGHNEIGTRMLDLEQSLHISNKKRE